MRLLDLSRVEETWNDELAALPGTCPMHPPLFSMTVHVLSMPSLIGDFL